MKKIIYSIFFILSLSVYADNSNNFSKKESEKIISQARAANSKAIKLKNEWRGTRKLIKKARTAHDKKNYKMSIKYANEALNQAKMAIEQHKSQQDYRYFD
ncbi:MAG: hypothetical protein CMD65_02130 [Gammaproteobacteria bacterium]|nr:hypothetical protein [Gammaproteobacteria bacterium]|tara:strand:+ start:77 stop:379 length:303 start_codon:yes stop_codon:yes gene_type:complete